MSHSKGIKEREFQNSKLEITFKMNKCSELHLNEGFNEKGNKIEENPHFVKKFLIKFCGSTQ